MRWILYNIAFAVAYLFLTPHFLLRMWRRGGYRRGFMQRFGVYDSPTRLKLSESRRIWVHAVSVGEMHIALNVIEQYRRGEPFARFVVSTTTSTAHAMARRGLSADHVLIYFPIDFPVIMRRVLGIIQPRAILVTEVELWPNLTRLAAGRGVPVMVINGRLSERSFRGYRRLRGLFAEVVNVMDRVCVQSPADAQRFRELGCDEDRLRILGSMKYDTTAAGDDDADAARRILDALGVASDTILLVGGSTWDGEERVLLDIYKVLKERKRELFLVLVPRHFERGDAVAAEIESSGLRCLRRSQPSSLSPTEESSVLLVDTTGELKGFYACASVVFVGKSLTQHGGQNVIEPAAYARPVVVGPNMENFAQIMEDFRSQDAIIQVASARELESELMSLVLDAERRQEIGERARRVIDSKSGAVAATLREIRDVLGVETEHVV
ncbi:MAG: 3-deoxy-D-manno-octulosonic acid transferase [Verrucomicrobia bacterium]|nr:3-deoxy-D-manno-octulosonic acid transferase [Verrucomicrobiota bacterium]